MREHVAQQDIVTGRGGRSRPGKPTAATMGRKLLDIVVYGKSCRIGDKLALDELAETSEIGDWKMPEFRLACTYAVSQGWLRIEGETLTLTTAGLAAA